MAAQRPVLQPRRRRSRAARVEIDRRGGTRVRLSIRIAFIVSAVFVLFAMVAGEPMAGATTMPQLISTGSSYAGLAISQWQGAVQRARRGQHQLRRVQLGHRSQRVLPADHRLRSQRPFLCGGPIRLRPDAGAVPLPVHPRRRWGACSRIQPDRYDREADQQPGAQRLDDRGDLHRSHCFVEQSGHRGPQPGRKPARSGDHRVLPFRPVRGELPPVGLPRADRPGPPRRLPAGGVRPESGRGRLGHLGLLPQRDTRQHLAVPQPPRSRRPERCRCCVPRSRAPARWDQLRRDGLRQERRVFPWRRS